MSKKFFISVESEAAEGEETAPVAVEAPVEAPMEEMAASAAEVEEGAAEVTGDVEELEEMHDSACDGVETGDTLAAVGDVIGEKVADGEGLSEDAAKLAEVVIESSRVRLGAKKSVMKIPSLENFKNKRAATESSKIALEAGVVSGLKTIWTGMLKFFKMVDEKLSAIFVGLTKSYPALVKHLTKLKAAAEAIPAEHGPSEAELNKPAIAKFFTDAASAEKVVASSDAIVAAADKVLMHVKDAAVPTDGSHDVSADLKALGEVISSVKIGEHITFELKDDGAVLEHVAGEASAVKALNKEETVKLLDAALGFAQKGPDLKKLAADAKDAAAKLSQHAEQALKSVEKVGEGDGAAAYKSIAKLAHTYGGVLVKVAGKLPHMHFEILKAAADYAMASIHNLKAAKPATEDAPVLPPVTEVDGKPVEDKKDEKALDVADAKPAVDTTAPEAKVEAKK